MVSQRPGTLGQFNAVARKIAREHTGSQIEAWRLVHIADGDDLLRLVMTRAQEMQRGEQPEVSPAIREARDLLPAEPEETQDEPE